MKLSIYLIQFTIHFAFADISIDSDSSQSKLECCFKAFYDDYGYPQFWLDFGWMYISSNPQFERKYHEFESDVDVPF